MATFKRIIVCSFIFFTVFSYKTEGQQVRPEIGIIEKLDNYLPDSLFFTNENGELVNFNKYFDKPTILNLVYYRCPGICSPIMESIANVIEKNDLEIGKDYQVLTVSFNPLETYELGVKKKKNYLNLIKTKKAQDGWQYFAGDSLNISRLTEAVGFYYKKTGNDFLHPGTLIIISPQQKITRYLNGTYFLPFEVKLALAEAAEGKSGTTINKVLQYCYNYDPVGQKYVLNVTKISATIIIFLALVIFGILIARQLLKK